MQIVAYKEMKMFKNKGYLRIFIIISAIWISASGYVLKDSFLLNSGKSNIFFIYLHDPFAGETTEERDFINQRNHWLNNDQTGVIDWVQLLRSLSIVFSGPVVIIIISILVDWVRLGLSESKNAK